MNWKSADGRWDVPTAMVLRRLAGEPLPLGLCATSPSRVFMRDEYYDTTDSVLRARGATCRIRHRADDHMQFFVAVVRDGGDDSELMCASTDLACVSADDALNGTSDPARLLRSIVSPRALAVQLELEIERYSRAVLSQWLRRARFDLKYDVVTVRVAGLSRTFHEIALRSLGRGRPTARDLSQAISDQYALRSLALDRRNRGEQLRAALESEALARGVVDGNWVAVIALDGQCVAHIIDDDGARLPIAEGSGEAACRHVLRRSLGSSVGDLRLLTTVRGGGRLRSLEVWACTRLDRSDSIAGQESVTWTTVDGLLAMVGSPAIRDAATIAALQVLAQSSRPHSPGAVPAAAPRSREDPVYHFIGASPEDDVEAGGPPLDVAMALLAFHLRVLELAEDSAIPLLERLRYLSIVSTNLDEFFAVEVGGIKYGDQEGSDEEIPVRSSVERLLAIGDRVRSLAMRQAACVADCERQLAAHGIHVRSLSEVSAEAGQYLRTYFRNMVLPYLTPRAVTATPGHSLPLIADQALHMVTVLGGPTPDGSLHLAVLAVPAALPRFLPLPDGASFVPIEDLIRRESSRAYPGRRVQSAHLFRLTRCASLGMADGDRGDLAQTIEERSLRRRHQPVVRIEVEPSMPMAIRERLVQELQLEPGARPGALGPNDVYAVPGRINIRDMAQLADLPRPALRFTSLPARRAVDEGENLWATLRHRDLLLHHPYDGFATSVVRFFADAADDGDVVSMKATLYRVGEHSPVIEALLRAASAGKDVTVFMELKARFDEQRNVHWARQLEAAGAHVVLGMSGVKVHAKMALVVRREANGPRRYAHISTGNYNTGTARAYTDLGLLTSHEGICLDVNDLFNTLTGSSVPADVAYRDCLVAPHALLAGVLQRIEREAAHARANGSGHIRIKVNGLSDRAVVQALYRAARDGVEIDLLVRGICTLGVGRPGISERIRVVSVLGRFLEHARIFSFANGGSPEYFIGSADLRPRNLRRRVEVLVPVYASADRRRLDHILDVELNDPTAWTLEPDGSYARRSGTGAADAVSAQARFAAEVTQ